MALEVAPAKALPAARSDSSERPGAKAGGPAKAGPGNDPAGFLALLMGIELEPSTAMAADAESLADQDAQTRSEDDPLADALAAALPTAAPLPETPTLPVALPTTQGLSAARTEGPHELAAKLTLDLGDKPSAGKSRRGVLADSGATMGTQQLQNEASKAQPSAKPPELAPSWERAVAEVAPQAVTVAAPVAASEEARKLTHGLQAKLETATDKLAMLTSGLSVATASTSPTFDISAPGAVAQFQSVVAEEVAYYISNDVQNAEMKLEGVGGGPVEVSINLQGNEAQVVFRTDEVQTRAALESAGAQLKDMLQQQGVVLTGVYVGTSGAGAGGEGDPGERKFRQGQRAETTVRVAGPELAGAQRVPTGSVGGKLDLYV